MKDKQRKALVTKIAKESNPRQFMEWLTQRDVEMYADALLKLLCEAPCFDEEQVIYVLEQVEATGSNCRRNYFFQQFEKKSDRGDEDARAVYRMMVMTDNHRGCIDTLSMTILRNRNLLKEVSDYVAEHCVRIITQV